MSELQTFFLYGEPPRTAGAGFLHVEPLDLRSRQSGWSIRPHRHTDLNHLFLLAHGGGDILSNDGPVAFQAPCLLLIPAGVAHGFTFLRESSGHVLTVSSDYMARRPSCEEAAGALFSEISTLDCREALEPLQSGLRELARELSWLAPAHAAAVEAALLRIFVLALRLQHRAEAARIGGAGREAALVARFREEVDRRFRQHEALEGYARTLCCSLSRLHRACRRCTGQTPLQIIQARLSLEARRQLLYSDASVAEVAADLGYSDPAYFSRVFSRRNGVSAMTFRRSRAALA